MKLCTYRTRGITCYYFAVLHDHHPIRCVINILQTVFGDENGGTQFQIDFANRVQKIRCCNGVQLAGRLIQNQYLRLQGHDGSQIQQLLLTAGKGCHILMKPALDAKIAGHLRHPQAHCLLVNA